MKITTQNHFELFGLPLSFEVDQQQLAERYRALQRTVHPDRFANASDQERRLSVQRAAQINEALQTLKSPIQRARYMLELCGVEFGEQRDTAIDPMFLMEQMELREALADIPGSEDALGKLGRLQDDIRARIKQLTGELSGLFAESSDESMQQAKAAVQKLQFMAKLQQEADNVEEDLANAL